MEVLTGIITDAEVVNSTQVVIDSKLPDTEVEVSKSITAEVSPDNYVLSSGGMYGAGFTGAAPTWLLDAIQQELSTGTGNVMSVLEGIQTVLDSLTLGVNQNIAQIESTILSQASLATSVQSQINANEASILDVAATRVTPLQAQTIATQVQQSTFGVDATAFIGNIASTYVGVGSAIAQDINLITAELNDVNVSISTIDSINIAQNATISQLQTDTGVSIADLQAQLDKSIDTWFYNEIPTLLNVPAVGWATITDKKAHNGDLYYNKTTGLAYSYSYVNSVESWVSVIDPTTVNSLKELSLREDTIDGKRSVYYTATEPAPKAEDGVTAIAIETGDLWINSTTSITKVRSSGGVWVDITNTATENAIIDLSILEETNDGVVATFYQTTAPTAGMSYGDWWVDTDAVPMVAYRYQDSNGKNVGTVTWYNESTSIIGKAVIDSDTAKRQAADIVSGTTQINLNTYINTPWEAELNTWITNVFTPFQSDMYTQIDSVIETHFGEVVPTLGNLPASAWTTTLLKDSHLGDLYYDSISGIGYRFLLVGGVYSWGVISDSGVAAALQAASNAQDTADGKRRVFLSSWNGTVWTAVLPIAPYDRGDIFTPLVDTVSGAVTYYKGEMYVCNVSKTVGVAFANGDFVSATNYKYIEGLVSTLDGELGSLQNLTDLKIESYYQAAVPHQEVSLPKVDVLVPTYDTYIKDVWYSTTSENKTYIYKREDNELYAEDNGLVGDAAGTNETNGLVNGEVLLLEEDLGNLLGIDGTYDNKYYYRWVETPVPTEVFDQIDSKKTIYVSQPIAYNERDILIPNVSFTVDGLVFNANEIYIAQSNSTVFNKLHWIKATKYTDDTRVQNIINGLEQIDLSQHVNSLGWVTQTNLNAITTNIGLDIATVDGKINAEEIARITAVATEASVRSSAISARILEDARLDGVITAEEQARINAINAVDAAYKEYNRVVTLAIADGVLTPTEEALIANAAVAVAAAKQRFVDVETMASTTDGLLDTFLTVTYINDISGIQTQIDGKSVSWFQESEPFNSATGTVAQNGDIWFKTSTKELRVYVYSTLTWNLITDPKAIEAYNAASTAQNTADGKIQNYVVQPTTPYYVGDTWMQGSTGDIYVCDTERLTGAFLQSDWSIASKYTDDTTATTAMNNAATADGKAVDALNKLSDIASDDKLTPSEKQTVKLEWDIIVAEKPKVDANALTVGVSSTAYGIKYTALEAYIVSLIANLTTTSDIVGTTFRTTFKDYYDAKIDLLNAIAVKINTVAVNKPDVYAQTTAPSSVGRVVGDLWVDTDDKNHLYRWNGTSWTDVRDGSIADASGSASLAMTAATNAMTAAQAAQATADGAIRTWYQATAPIGLNATTDVGDMWFDTDDNQAYRWNGTVWNVIEDNSIAVALQAAQNAQSTADGKITSFYDPISPSIGMESGDLWYDTDDKNKPYYYNGTTWVALRDGTIADAQTTANAKSIILYQDTIPTILTHPLLDTGDQWVNTTSKELKVWDGDSWETTTNDVANKAYVAAIATPNVYNAAYGYTPVPVAPNSVVEGDLWIVTDRWYVYDPAVQNLGAYSTTRTTYGLLVKRYQNGIWIDLYNVEAKNSAIKWEAKSSKYITAPDGSITGFEMSDGSATNSAFTITADTFKVVASGQSVASRNPLVVEASTGEITFNGKVSFNSVTDVPIINKTYSQTSAPTSGMVAGDTWLDSDGGYAVYTYSGTSWVAGGAKIYSQIDAPTSGMIIGDLWIDTDSNNKIYRYSGTSWVDQTITTAGIIGAINGTANTTTIDGGKITTGSIPSTAIIGGIGVPIFYQATIPTTTVVNSLWFDTDDNYHQYVWNGVSWVNASVDVATWVNSNTTTINGGKITADSIDAGVLKANSVVANNIAINAITASKIVAGTITASEIAANTITAGQIAASTITSTQIAATSITGDRLAVNSAWISGIVQSSDFTTIGGAGFRLKAEATSTNADPDIYGAYIRGGTIDGTTINASTINIRDLNIVNDSGYSILPIFSCSPSLGPDTSFTDPMTWDFLTDMYTYNSTNASLKRTIGATGTTISISEVDTTGIPAPSGYLPIIGELTATFTSLAVYIQVGATTLASRTSFAVNTDYNIGGFIFRLHYDTASAWDYVFCIKDTTSDISIGSTSSNPIHIKVVADWSGTSTYRTRGFAMLVSNL